MAEKKWTIGREYLTETCFSEQDFEFMEKDRRTHSSDWLDTSKQMKGYKKYSDREPFQFVQLSRGLEAKINDAFRIPLRDYITDVCSMTSDRPFYDAYIDVKIYRDPEMLDVSYMNRFLNRNHMRFTFGKVVFCHHMLVVGI